MLIMSGVWLLGVLYVQWVCVGSVETNGRWKDLQPSQLLDLTHPFNTDTIYWVGAKNFTLQRVFQGKIKKKGSEYFYSANNFAAAEHGGTHMDAPFHFDSQGIKIHQVPLEDVIGEGCVVDVEGAVGQEGGGLRVGVGAVEEWERREGRRVDSCILLFRTGWEKHWHNRTKYLGLHTLPGSDTTLLQFPGIHPDTADWLVKNRKIKAVGLDTASIDYGSSTLFRTHQILAAKNIPAFENLMNLAKLPPSGSTIIGLPMKIENGSGGPARVIAILPSTNKNSPEYTNSSATNLRQISVGNMCISLVIVLAMHKML